jgi:deoxyribodipyrimidine photo-lyase
MTTLVWLQRDLRLQDHAALHYAIARQKPYVVGYFHDPDALIGEANALWLAHSLLALQHSLRERGGELLMIEGRFEDQLDQLIAQLDIDEVVYHFEVGEPFAGLQQQALAVCKRRQIPLIPFDQAWYPHEEVRSQKGGLYSVFTPYYKKMLTLLNRVALPLDAPAQLMAAPSNINADWRALPAHLHQLSQQPWAQTLSSTLQAGEQAAWQTLTDFNQHHLNGYPQQRDFPAQEATSSLSPHLHFGEISAIEATSSLQNLKAHPDYLIHAIDSVIRQLAWREFGRYLLFFNPALQQQAFQSKFQTFPWSDNPTAHQRWQRGQTGIPIIDAGMRQLWQTGRQHNRVRMLCASWLSKNLNLPWTLGQAWYNNTLFDADPANNAMGWQWVAGCGVDAAPYYRLFNPVIQSEKFDPQAAYIKRWLPELKSAPPALLHAPWKHQPTLREYGIKLGETYPILNEDLEQTRQHHLQRVEANKRYT